MAAKGGQIDAGAPPVGLNNSVAGLYYFHILSIQSQTPPRVHIEQPDSRCATAELGQTANTVGLVIPGRGLQYRQLFLSGILMESLAEDVCSFVPTWMWFGNTASPALYCRGSEPARLFLGVLPQSFIVVAVRFLTVCLWIWMYSRTKMFHAVARSQFCSIVFLRPFKLTPSLISVSCEMKEMMFRLHGLYFTCENWNGLNLASGGGNWTWWALFSPLISIAADRFTDVPNVTTRYF